MRLVITGALGHLGSKLIRALPFALENAELILVDDVSTQRYFSLFHLPPEGKYYFLEGSVLKLDFDPIFRGADAVVHLAAMTNATDSFRREQEIEDHNLVATRRVAEACARTKVPLVFLSTTSLYGGKAPAIREDAPPEQLHPQSPYARTKWHEEQLLEAMGRTAGLKYCTFRFATMFGTSPAMRFHTAVNKFCWQASLGRPVTVWQTALQQQRPYLDIDDAVRLVSFVLQRRHFPNTIYNAATLTTTVDEIIRLIRRDVPGLQVELTEAAVMNDFSFGVSTEKIQATGFRFEGDLARSIHETLAMLRGVRSANLSFLNAA